MIGFLAATQAERRLIPGGRLQGPTPYVIAIMMFVMVVIGAAGLALAHSARLVAAGVDNRYSVEIADGAAKAARAQAVLASSPGVIAVRPVSEAEMRKILQRWLGPAGAASDLPLPAIIDIDLAPDAPVAAIAANVERQVPGARFVAHKDSLGPVLGAVRSLSWLAMTLVVLIALATAAAVVLAARARSYHLRLSRVHASAPPTTGGATVQRRSRSTFDRRPPVRAAGVLLLLIAAADRPSSSLHRDRSRSADVVLLALLPLAGTILATIVARMAVLKALRASL